jgi:hypothetical protein
MPGVPDFEWKFPSVCDAASVAWRRANNQEAEAAAEQANQAA